MTAEDLAIIRDVRRLLDKQPIDTNRVDIQVLKGGKVYLTGNIAPMRSQPTVNVKEQVEEFERRARKFPHIKEIFMNCRLIEPARKHGDNAEHAIKEHDERVAREKSAAEEAARPAAPLPSFWD